MTSTTDILTIVKKGRSETVDWLAEGTPIEQIAETMIAIANSSGGTLLVGVENDKIIGVDNIPATSDHLLEAALSTDPALIIPLPKIAQVQESTIIMAQIPSGLPHVYGYNGRYLQRDGTENAPLTPQALRRLMIERGEISFETNIAPGTTLDDIDWDKVQQYTRNLTGFSENNTQQVLLKRGCLIRREDEVRPTNAGILLFGKDPQRHLIGSDISAVRFPHEIMGDTFNRQDITGTLPDQIKRAETFLRDHMHKNVRLRDKMQREEDYEYPLEAARELVVNAVAHRDYAIRGDNIRLFLFSNRMEVHSPGGLPGPMTLQNLRDQRFSRNPVIVQVLADMHFIEKLGYGVDRVLELMNLQNLREPIFEEREGGFRVSIYNDTKQRKITTQSALSPQSSSIQDRYKVHNINSRQEAALTYLHSSKNNRITNGDMKTMFPDVHPETIRRDLADLVTKAILVKMGQKRGSYYILKEQATVADKTTIGEDNQ